MSALKWPDLITHLTLQQYICLLGCLWREEETLTEGENRMQWPEFTSSTFNLSVKYDITATLLQTTCKSSTYSLRNPPLNTLNNQ